MKTTLAPTAPWPSFAVFVVAIAASNERLAHKARKANYRPLTYQKAKP